jgi:type I restriction enzyme, S subunit
MMKTYERYKPSGVEWIGDIPEHWEVLPLKYLVSTKVTDGPHETPQIIDDGVPFVSAESVRDGKIDFNLKRGFISKEQDLIYSKKCKPRRDDIFIVKSGSTTGKIAYVDFDCDFNIWSPLALVRTTNRKAYSRYVYHFLQTDFFQDQVRFSWSFGTQPNIGMNVIENLKVIVPTRPEQAPIAKYLDEKTAQLDKLIEGKRNLIALLKEERSGIINNAVTRGINPQAKLKPSGIDWLGEIPEHWEVKKLKYLVSKVGSGITPSGGANVYQQEGIPLLRSQNIYSEGLVLEDIAFISEEIDEQMSNSRIQEDDILLNITGGSIGRCFYVPKGFGRGNVNQHVCIIRPIQSAIKTKFLHAFLISGYGQNFVDVCQTGANREGLNFQQIKSFDIPVCDVAEQKQIVQFIEAETGKIDATVAKIEKEIEYLLEYRTALISEVVTGKIKVV